MNYFLDYSYFRKSIQIIKTIFKLDKNTKTKYNHCKQTLNTYKVRIILSIN